MVTNSVCAVVVTFRPRSEDLLNLAAVRPQVEHLVVVDNGSNLEQQMRLRAASQEIGFTLIENGANHGIATALNTGVRCAESLGSKWVALFDQDSRVTDNFLQHLLEDFDQAAQQRPVMLIVPRYKDPVSGVERVCGLDADGGPFVTITSGSLLPVDAFAKCGYFRDELFIYTVDDEFSLRLRSKGYSIALSDRAVLLHASGVPTYFTLFGRRLFTTTNYRAGARYYVSRNRIWMWKNYGRRYPRYVRGALRSSLIDLMKLSVAETSRARKIHMVLRGFADGFRGRMGKTIELS